MPTYEYWCPKCEREFELKKPLSDFDTPGFSPDCGGQGERLISAFASKIGYNLQVPAKPPFRTKGAEQKK